MLECRGCKQRKPADDFPVEKRTTSGRASRCKVCKSQARRDRKARSSESLVKEVRRVTHDRPALVEAVERVRVAPNDAAARRDLLVAALEIAAAEATDRESPSTARSRALVEIRALAVLIADEDTVAAGKTTARSWGSTSLTAV